MESSIFCSLCKCTRTSWHMTGSEINHSFLFHGVLKNLAVCGVLRISIARCQIEAEIHSFPTMYIMGGVNIFEMGQIDDFVQNIARIANAVQCHN